MRVEECDQVSPGAAYAWEFCRQFFGSFFPCHCDGSPGGNPCISASRRRELSSRSGRRRRGKNLPVGGNLLVTTEAIHDSALLQIIRRHFHTNPVSGEDMHAIHAHATGKMAEELMIFGFQTQDLHSECCIWKGFHNRSDELNDILRHRGQVKRKLVKAGVSYRSICPAASKSTANLGINGKSYGIFTKILYNYI